MSFYGNLFIAFWFFLPAGLANMAPILAARLPGLRRWEFPMDCYLQFRRRRVLGPHKTIRGLIVGILTAMLAVWLQQLADPFYAAVNPWLLGFLLGLGALLGDALKSFFKRQLDIVSGESWLLFDQLDYILGAIVLSAWYVPLTWQQYLAAIIIWVLVHFLVSAIGHWLGLKPKAV